jgi:hypothetical protein
MLAWVAGLQNASASRLESLVASIAVAYWQYWHDCRITKLV